MMKIIQIFQAARQQSLAMQQKLLLYLISMLLAIFAVLLLILSFVGVFSGEEKELSLALESEHSNVLAKFNEQVSALAAQGIRVSEQATKLLDDMLYMEPTSNLNDEPALLKEIEMQLYDELYISLHSSYCNGVYIVLDATTNTALENAAHSRAGLYLRVANLSSRSEVNRDITLYRGIPDVARANQVELHNRWKMEFDTSLIDGYEQTLYRTEGKLADCCFWTRRTRLTDTWEDALLLVVPIRGSDDSVRGICGVELSSLYLRLSYPAVRSEFGSMVTLFVPLRDGQLALTDGLSGGIDGTYLDSEKQLQPVSGRRFFTYSGQNGNYLGMHSRTNMITADGTALYAVTLVPEEPFKDAAAAERIRWLIGSLGFFIIMMVEAVFVSKRFVRPILTSLMSIQTEAGAEQSASGISEIDSLVRFLNTKTETAGTGEHVLPEDVEDLLNGFAERASKLTVTERSIVQYYAEGKEVAEVAELAFISINTVRRHNSNIYQKLGVGAREELLLYIELFRRCGRLHEILLISEPPFSPVDR